MAIKSPTDILKKEHEKVLEILKRLESNLESKNIELMKKNIALIENEFSRHSLGKEEKALFPEIEKFIPRDEGPTGVMIMEHKELIRLIKDFKESLKIENFKRLSEIGNNISFILRPHIDKEDNILFMMAEMHLDNKQKNAILEKFKKFDKK